MSQINKKSSENPIKENVKNSKLELRRFLDNLEDDIGKTVSEKASFKEKFSLSFRCSTYGKNFKVFLSRSSKYEPFKKERIVREDEKVQEKAYNFLSIPEEELDIKTKEIDYNSLSCPYCNGGKWKVIKCGNCAGLFCGGGIKKDENKYLFQCPWCGIRGYIEGKIKEVRGKMVQEEAKQKENRRNLTGRAKGRYKPNATKKLEGFV